ncbi:b(0,+)-type amino acid transporter 1-like isoform X2 [Ciona intestinalis]
MGADTEIRQRKKLDSIADSDDKNVVELKKEVGIIGAISMVVGTMIGSGIFLSPAGILAKADSVGASLCVWAGCGILATLSALSYVELGLLIRKSGGEYQYLKTAFGNVAGFLVIWTSVIVTKPSSFAIISIGFAEYVTAPFYPGCTPPATIQKCAAAFCILLITSINCINVKLANFVQIFFTVAKMLIIVAIIIGGFVMMAQPGGTDNFVNAFEGSATSFSAIAVAFYGGLWSYDGWNQLNFITEEIQNPLRNFPLALMFGIPLVTVCYILVNIAYFTVMTPSEMLVSNAVAISFIALIMIIPDASSFSTLIDYFTFASWIFYGASFLSLIVLRYRKPDWERPYKVFIVVPVICFIASLYLIVAPIIDEPQLAYLYAAIFILAGLLFYFPLVHFKKVPAFMEPLSSFLQQVLEVVPPPDDEDEPDDESVEQKQTDFHSF